MEEQRPAGAEWNALRQSLWEDAGWLPLYALSVEEVCVCRAAPGAAASYRLITVARKIIAQKYAHGFLVHKRRRRANLFVLKNALRRKYCHFDHTKDTPFPCSPPGCRAGFMFCLCL